MEISVIVPVYNRAGVVCRTLESIKQQGYRPIHLILVDNNSTDGTPEILNKFKDENSNAGFRITVAREDKPGASAARNKGIKYVECEWMMFFDSDDLMSSDLLESYYEAIKKNEGTIDMVGSRSDYTGLNGSKRDMPYFKKDIMVNHICHAMLRTVAYIVRKDFFVASGMWNENLFVWNDWELGIRLLLANPRIIWIEDKVLVHIQAQRDSITGTIFFKKAGLWEKSIDKVEDDIEKTNVANKKQLLYLLDFRRVALAGLYSAEGSDEGKKLYARVMGLYKGRKILRFYLQLIYRYVSHGGRGASHPVKFISGFIK